MTAYDPSLGATVVEEVPVSGTGTVTLAGASTGLNKAFNQAFPASQANIPYLLAHTDLAEWERGFGSFTYSSNTFSRDTVLSSSNGNALVPFSDGTKAIYVLQPSITVSPYSFGAVGDGVTSDTAAINALFTFLRSVTSSTYSTVPYRVDFGNGTFLIDGNGVDATNIKTARRISLNGGVFIGKCTGKHVFDLTGSRWFRWTETQVYGDSTLTPDAGWFMCRLSTGASADLHTFISCSTNGQFSTAAVWNYGSETLKCFGCDFFNNYPGAGTSWSVLLEANNTKAVSSQFQTCASGNVSFLQQTFVECQFWRSPANTLTITGITRANPAVITYTGTDPANGDNYWIDNNVGGMTQIRNTKVTVASVNTVSKTFQCSELDSSAFTAYTSGGSAYRETGAAIYYNGSSGGAQCKFINCYGVAYHDHAVEIDCNGGSNLAVMLDCDIHLEGVHGYAFKFTTADASGKDLRNFRYRDNAPNAFNGLFTTDASTNAISCQDFTVDIIQPPTGITWAVGMFSNQAMFSLTGEMKMALKSLLGTVPGSHPSFRVRTYAADRTPTVLEYRQRGTGTDTGSGVSNDNLVGRYVTQTLNAAAGATNTITVTNTNVTTSDLVTAAIVSYAGTGSPIVQKVVPGSGSFVVTIVNTDTAVALNAAAALFCEVTKISP